MQHHQRCFPFDSGQFGFPLPASSLPLFSSFCFCFFPVFWNKKTHGIVHMSYETACVRVYYFRASLMMIQQKAAPKPNGTPYLIITTAHVACTSLAHSPSCNIAATVTILQQPPSTSRGCNPHQADSIIPATCPLSPSPQSQRLLLKSFFIVVRALSISSSSPKCPSSQPLS